MSPANTIRTALRGLTSNKLRLALTMLGVIIGVASVIAMLSIGNGARAAVESSFRFLGSDSIQIMPAMAIEDGTLVDAGKILSFEDGLQMPESVELVDRVEMSIQGTGKVRYEGVVLDISITGVTADALKSMSALRQVQPVGGQAQPKDGQAQGLPLQPEAFIDQGRFFTPEETLSGTNVCVLGSDTADQLFKGDDPIDQVVWVNRQRCQVIGVLVELETTDPEQRYRSKPNETFFLPISTAILGLYEDEPSVSIVAHVVDESRMEEAKQQVRAYLRERHEIQPDAGGVYADDFSLTTKQDVLGARQEAVHTFSVLLAAMASISLIVGGIGIMNVMLVSVTERTREIGVRLAIGASQRDIVAQFLMEAVLISAVGGVLGIASGILSIPLASSFSQGLALLAPASIPLALGVSLLTGLVFGIYPALRASLLDPIEALRYE